MRVLLALLLVLCLVNTSFAQDDPPESSTANDPDLIVDDHDMILIFPEPTAEPYPIPESVSVEVQPLYYPPNLSDYVTGEYAVKFTQLVNEYAQKHLPNGEDLRKFTLAIWSIAVQESGCQHCTPRGLVKRGGSGEYGCMQILSDRCAIKQLYDLHTLEGNIECGAHWFSYGLETTHGNYFKAFTWYNSGSTHSGAGKRYARSVNHRLELWLEAPDTSYQSAPVLP